jgi:hypothetical protein
MGAQLAPGTQSRWVAYYIESDMSGTSGVYVQQLDGKQERFKISSAGGSHPRWRRDGRELFYVSPEPELKLMAVDIMLEPHFSAGIPRPLFEPKLRAFTPFQYDVAPDGQRFLVLRSVVNQSEPLTLVQNWTNAIAEPFSIVRRKPKTA